jgi:GGDEF domain-containing protein
VIFGIVALDMTIRAVHAALGPPLTGDLAFFEEPAQGHTLFAMTIGLVCLSISGLSTMAHERLLHIDGAIDRADHALYQAKHERRSRMAVSADAAS